MKIKTPQKSKANSLMKPSNIFLIPDPTDLNIKYC